MRKLRFSDVFQVPKVNKDSISEFQTPIHVSLFLFLFLNFEWNWKESTSSYWCILSSYLFVYISVLSLACLLRATISESQ